jgi:uncharacterized membrane protein
VGLLSKIKPFFAKRYHYELPDYTLVTFCKTLEIWTAPTGKCSRVVAMLPEDDLRQQIAELSARVASLGATVSSLEAAVEGLRPAHPAASAPLPSGNAVPVHSSPPPPPPRGGAASTAGAKPASSLESRIGAQLLNRIGILAVLIGTAWFLKLAFDRNWIGPGIRIWIGLVCAAALVVWSERFRRHGFSAFSYSLKALGTSIAYLSLWAASSVYHLAPTWLIFLAMTAVTIVNAVLARRQRSELLAIYALAGGLATPGLLAMGHDSAFFLFSYLALLNAGTLLLLALHPWKKLAWAALLGTAVYYIGWTLSEDDPSRFLVTGCFMGLFFAGFAAAPFLILCKAEAPDARFPVAFPIANACATWIGLMAILAEPERHPARPWVTVALALACLLMAAALRAPAAVAIARTYLGLGVVFVAVAVPLQFHGYGVTLCWLGESLALIAFAKAGSHAAMRVFGAALLIVTACSLLLDWILPTAQPLAVAANMYFATNLIGAAVFAAVTYLSLGELSHASPAREFGSWRYLAGFAGVAFSLTLLVAVSLEIHHYWYCGAGVLQDFCRSYDRERRDIAAGFSYSAWCMLYGSVLMTAGFLRRSAFLRWQALVLLAFSIGMVFLNGVTHESQGYRVLSFLVLGVLLLAVSFAYQRDWLRLRG